MLNIVKQIITFYFENNRVPIVSDLQIENQYLLSNKEPIFITLYLWWTVRWAAWSINCIKNNIVEELIDLTINALINDSRFDKINKDDATKLNIRIDTITNRNVVENEDTFNKLNHIKDWVIVISKIYNKLVVLLPNISNTINNKEDFIKILSKKIWEPFIFDNYIVYKIDTKIESDF